MALSVKRLRLAFRRARRRFMGDHSGATALEYALIASLLVVAMLSALMALTGNITEVFAYLDRTLSAFM
jgi:pilus assembly protein Flp/PilA